MVRTRGTRKVKYGENCKICGKFRKEGVVYNIYNTEREMLEDSDNIKYTFVK